MVVDSQITDLEFLNMLAARNLIYDVVFEEDQVDTTPTELAQYRLVIAAPSVALRPGWRRYSELTPADLEAASPVNVIAPDSVVVNIYGQSQSGRMLVHLLNYADKPVFNVDIKVNGQFATAHVLSPDMEPRSIPVLGEGQSTRIRIPELRIYDLVVLEP